jgi:hypothetical protein
MCDDKVFNQRENFPRQRFVSKSRIIDGSIRLGNGAICLLPVPLELDTPCIFA